MNCWKMCGGNTKNNSVEIFSEIFQGIPRIIAREINEKKCGEIP